MLVSDLLSPATRFLRQSVFFDNVSSSASRLFSEDELRDVASATGAAEPLKYTRRQTQMQRTVIASTSNKEKGEGVVEEEDADELSQDEGEEEYNSNCNESDEDNDIKLEILDSPLL
ncbi:hypothetical protein CR513_59399, partial [Mucuna pruriens]